jgi:uncharacterized membrane protein (DUF106 family)
MPRRHSAAAWAKMLPLTIALKSGSFNLINMDAIYDILESLSDALLIYIVQPILNGIDTCLAILFSPLAAFSPLTQIIVAALLGALISRLLASRYRSRRAEPLQKEFDAKLSAIKDTRAVADEKIERVLRKGMRDSADETYEKLILDRFIEMGISYSLPLFFLLIWLEYSRFTSANLKALTGSPYAWMTTGGLNLSAAYVYFFFFNVFVISLWLFEKLYRKLRPHPPASP